MSWGKLFGTVLALNYVMPRYRKIGKRGKKRVLRKREVF